MLKYKFHINYKSKLPPNFFFFFFFFQNAHFVDKFQSWQLRSHYYLT